MIDYRALLKRYINHVHEEEGTTFIDTYYSQHLDAADLAELKILDDEAANDVVAARGKNK